jgi:hypothetical protein
MGSYANRWRLRQWPSRGDTCSYARRSRVQWSQVLVCFWPRVKALEDVEGGAMI